MWGMWGIWGIQLIAEVLIIISAVSACGFPMKKLDTVILKHLLPNLKCGSNR